MEKILFEIGTEELPANYMPNIIKELQALALRNSDRVSVNILFDEGLAHRVYAGSDLFLMPSRYEACGLSQMIAMRYGTVPVVRETGGLKDSVTDFEKFTNQEGNGLSFFNFNAHELLFTVKRGLSYYAEKPIWKKLVLNAMRSDNSWENAAKAYASLYEKVLHGNRRVAGPRQKSGE